MGASAAFSLLLLVLPLLAVPTALGACAIVVVAGGCTDAGFDGSSTSYACVLSVPGPTCVMAGTRPLTTTGTDGYVCAVGPGFPRTCYPLP